MGYLVSHGADAANSNEGYIFIAPSDWVGDGSQRAALWFRGGLASTYLTDSGPDTFQVQLALRGVASVSFQNGSIPQFGNATSLSNATKAWSLLKTTFGAKTDKVVLLAGSRGFADADNWARANPTLVAGMLGLWPLCSLIDVHDNDRGSAASAIETAYTNLAGWNAAKATKDPVTNAAAVAGIPGKIYYAVNDPTTLPAYAKEYARLAGWPTKNLGPMGHVASYPDWDEVASVVRAWL